MTEKSEDQVIAVCENCFNACTEDFPNYDILCGCLEKDLKTPKEYAPYIKLSTYESLNSKLVLALKALEQIVRNDELCTKGAYVVAPRPEEIAKEALGKIGEK